MDAPTPKEFAKHASKIINETGGDTEVTHAELDDYLCQTLNELGYGAGVRLFQSVEKWYA